MINDWIWSPLLLLFLAGAGVFLTICTGGIQRHLWKGIRLSMTRDWKMAGEIPLFTSFAVGLATSLGAGSFVGVTTAVAFGGAGAIFWLCITGGLGMAMRYGEALLSMEYRMKMEEDTVLGGIMCVWEYGVKQRWLGILFAVLLGVGVFFIGNLPQSNVIAGVAATQFSSKPYITVIFLLLLTGSVLSGGIQSIGGTCKKIVPCMVVLYIVGCMMLLFQNRSYLLQAVQEIFARAFTASAMGGSFAGIGAMTAVRYGLTQGFFVDGTGLGGTPILAAAAQAKNPVRAALVSMTISFWNTIIVCGLTGLVVVSSMLQYPTEVQGLSGGTLVAVVFNSVPGVGPILLTVSLLIFSWTALLGWAYCGEKAWIYLLGKKSCIPFRILWIVIAGVGCIKTTDIFWEIGDVFRGCLAAFSSLTVLMCSGVIVRKTRQYLKETSLETPEERTF